MNTDRSFATIWLAIAAMCFLSAFQHYHTRTAISELTANVSALGNQINALQSQMRNGQ